MYRVALDLMTAASEATTLEALASRTVPLLARCASASHGLVAIIGKRRLQAFGSISPMGAFGMTDYQRRYMARDPVLAGNLAAGCGVIRASHHIDYRRFKKTELFDEIYRQQDASTVMFCRFAMASEEPDAHGLTLMRASRERDFSVRDEQRITQLLPILSGAWRRLRRAQRAEQTAALLQQLLVEMDPRPRVVFDQYGERLWASSEAERILRGHIPQRLSDIPGELPADVRLTRPITLPRPGHTPVRATLHRAARQGDYQIAVIEDYSQPSPRIRRLAEDARLTPAETQTLAALAARRSTRQIASGMCISVATVRTHVKRVLAKLGVHSRAELVARVEGRSRDATALC